MSPSAARAFWESGQFCALCEYRLSKAELLIWRDKTNGSSRSAPILRHTVECGQVSVTVTERVGDSVRIEDIRVPFSKGEACLLVLTELKTERGVISARGQLVKLVAVSPPATAGVGTASGGALGR
jgi:hypothetical protein